MQETLLKTGDGSASENLQSLSAALLREGMIARVSPMGISYVFEDGTGKVFNCPTAQFPGHPELGRKVRFRILDSQIVDLEFV